MWVFNQKYFYWRKNQELLNILISDDDPESELITETGFSVFKNVPAELMKNFTEKEISKYQKSN